MVRAHRLSADHRRFRGDYATSKLRLRLTGPGMVVFAGWVMPVAVLAHAGAVALGAPLGIAGVVLASFFA